jgi:hypothetical protein
MGRDVMEIKLEMWEGGALSCSITHDNILNEYQGVYPAVRCLTSLVKHIVLGRNAHLDLSIRSLYD